MIQRWRTLCLSLSIALSGLHCSLGDSSRDIETKSPSEPYVSPYQSQKVILDAKSMVADSHGAPTEMMAEGLKLSVMVNNECAEKKCAEATDSASLLSCQLFQSADHAPLKQQFYPYRLSASKSVEEIRTWVQSDECVLGVSENNSFKAQAFDDTHFTQQKPYLDTVKFEESLRYFTNLEPVKIAVVDTGIGTHPDLGSATSIPGVVLRQDLRSTASKTAPGCQAASFSLNAPWHPHGTYVGGIIGASANNTRGIAGVASNAKLLSFAVGDCTGAISTTEVANAIMASIENGAEVINLSLGGPTSDVALLTAVQSALNSHVVIVASAGNQYQDIFNNPTYPAYYSKNYPGVIAVAWGKQNGAFEPGNGTTSGSNFSNQVVKILAPGSGIASTVTNGTYPGFTSIATGYSVASGTSASAPLVTGAVALAIGFMKKRGLSYDEATVDRLVTNIGATYSSSATPFVRNGATLNFQKLGESLDYLLQTGASPKPVILSGQRTYIDYTNPNQPVPVVQVTATWNLENTHFGARIGLFDTSPGCTYSSPCLVQDFALPSNSGSMQFTISRNQTLPMLPAVTSANPSFSLYMTVAIYYPLKGKSEFGLDALQRFDLRTVDGSRSDSPLLAKVTNIRSDMQHLYIQGWACLQGDNEALPVQIISDGKPVLSNYAYRYPLMVPHGTPIDTYSYSRSGGPFKATLTDTAFKNGTNFRAGLEADARLISDCLTLTTAQGFEFAIPLSTLANGLEGKTYIIQATHPHTGAKTTLLNSYGNSSFVFPEVNFHPTPETNIIVQRTGDVVKFAGTICSKSPSPTTLEISFSEYDVRCRLARVPNFPNFSNPCSLMIKSGRFPPMLHHTTYNNPNRQSGVYIDSLAVPMLQPVANLGYTALELATLNSRFPGLWPNAVLSFTPSPSAAFRNLVAGEPLIEVNRGIPIGAIQSTYVSENPSGDQVDSLISNYLQSRSDSSVELVGNDSRYWDYDDVGEPFSSNTIAYSLKPNTIGRYLAANYGGVKKLMREIKKFETPLGVASQVVAFQSLAAGTPGNASCPYVLKVNATTPGLRRLVPALGSTLNAILEPNEPPMVGLDHDTMDQAIAEVPLDLRFFQDGVMILHLVTDYGTRTTPIPTLGRGN